MTIPQLITRDHSWQQLEPDENDKTSVDRDCVAVPLDCCCSERGSTSAIGYDFQLLVYPFVFLEWNLSFISTVGFLQGLENQINGKRNRKFDINILLTHCGWFHKSEQIYPRA